MQNLSTLYRNGYNHLLVWLVIKLGVKDFEKYNTNTLKISNTKYKYVYTPWMYLNTNTSKSI